MVETFYGYIETTQDVLLVFEACRRGLLPKVSRRLQEKERKLIRSGSVFVFDERESGIKRWTDGLVWSPSRILGNFLIYRELDKRIPGDKKPSYPHDARHNSYSQPANNNSVYMTDKNRERRLVGSLSDSYRFRRDGLIKKTMSIIIHGVHQHLISYYLPNDIIENKLRTPSSVPELASLEISPDLLVKQNFRIPPMVEPSFDQNNMTASPTNRSDDRRMHPFRSMSMGSVGSSNQSQMMYSTNSLFTLMSNDKTNNNNSNLTAYYNNGNTLFQTLPSPTSLTSSPNTPMLSPVRPSFPQNNRYSISSTSSMRHTSRPNNYEIESSQETSPHLGQLLNPVHPLKRDDGFYLPHDTTQDYYQKPPSNTPSTIPMFRNTMNMYDETQNTELGIEPLMLK